MTERTVRFGFFCLVVFCFYGVCASIGSFISDEKRAKLGPLIDIPKDHPILNENRALHVYLDFQCEPCRRLHFKIRHGKLSNLTIRIHTFPLSKVHPQAERAAVLWHQVRDPRKRERLSDQLFGTILSEDRLKELEKSYCDSERCVGREVAELKLKEDQRDAFALGISATPRLLGVENGKIYAISAEHKLDTL